MPNDPPTDPAPEVPMDLRHNQFAFGGDSFFFNVGVNFIPVTTVLTALVAQLTPNKTLVGAVSMAWTVGWLAPQLLAARLVRGKTRTKPYAAIPGALSRPIMLLLALWLWWDHGQSPQLSVWIILIGIALFTVTDGLTTSAWFDMQGRALSSAVRSRVIFISSLLASLTGLGAGYVVEQVLSDPALPFPVNYALLLALAFFFFYLSLGSMLFIRERPAQIAHAPGAAVVGFGTHLRAAVVRDPVLRRLLFVRLVSGIENMAAAFYVVFARERLGLPASSVGVFTTAVIAGGLIGVTIFGWLAIRFGSRRVILAAAILQTAAPLLAFAVASLGLAISVAYPLMIVVMGLNGAINRSMMLGYFQYAQDSAPGLDRPMYIGAVSTVAGTAALMPLVGGVLVDTLTAAGQIGVVYPLLFGIAVLCALCGAVASVGLRAPRL